MAKKSGPNQSPEAVKLEIDRSRERLARDVRGLRYELDIPGKIRRSFQQQTAVWVVAAVVVGAVVVTLPRLRKKVYVNVDGGGKGKSQLLETGFLLGAARIAVTLLKPALISFIRSRMAGGSGAAARSSRKW